MGFFRAGAADSFAGPSSILAHELAVSLETGTEIQIANAPRAAIHSTGAAYDRIEANPAVDDTADVWHRMEILMIGHHLRIRVDGVTTIDVADLQAAYPAFNWPLAGLIGLQDSHKPSGTVEYRNIQVIPLVP